MKLSRSIRLGIGAIAVALAATACGGDEQRSALESAEAGNLTIGIKFDQPGLGLRNPDGTFTGFDVDVAKYVADQLGVTEENITFKEAPSAQRETLIQNGEVDYIVGTYSITDTRKEKVDFAGPYFIAGQSLLVRSDNTDITGPRIAEQQQEAVLGEGLDSRTERQGQVRAAGAAAGGRHLLGVRGTAPQRQRRRLTTDDIILAGYAAQYPPGELKVVGEPFTTERYGIGLAKGDEASRTAINEAITEMIASGAWQAAFDANFGDSGYQLAREPADRRVTLPIRPARGTTDRPDRRRPSPRPPAEGTARCRTETWS